MYRQQKEPQHQANGEENNHDLPGKRDDDGQKTNQKPSGSGSLSGPNTGRQEAEGGHRKEGLHLLERREPADHQLLNTTSPAEAAGLFLWPKRFNDAKF